MRSNVGIGIVLIVLILAVGLLSSTSVVSAQPVTLADTLYSVINNVNWGSADSWTSTWGTILANMNLSAFDSAISQDISSGNYLDALYVARLADLSGYNSTTISESTQTALQHMAMCGSLPINANAHGYGDPDVLNQGCFLVYSRFLLWGYEYAEQFGLTGKWDKNKAFADFARMFDKPPVGSTAGEMLWCDPQENWADSYSSRYYDEHAETLSVFLKFAEMGVPGAMAYADKAWNGVQSHWNGQYYGYTGTATVECEMGNFAQVVAEYMKQSGENITNWDRVIQDLNYKLLANGWSSPGWAGPGIIIHAQGVNTQTRLWETMGAMTALQELFPYFTPSMKTSFDNLLMGSAKAWQGLMSSNLNSEGHFIGESGSQPSNDATVCAAAILFLDGIVPVTGNLAIPMREENYGDHRTSFLASEFQFDYKNHRIRIPVNAGQLTFIYGSAPVSYNFQANGVYDVQFSSDWNQITSVNGQPVTAQAPSAPQNLKATAGSAQVTLSWSAPLSDGGSAITGYNIYKGTASGAETLYTTIGNALTYTDMAVANGQTYYYKVTATNSVGESGSSNEASATPSAPSVKTLSVAVGTNKATYSRWSSVSITVTVKDSATGKPIQGASVKVTVYYPSGSAVWTGLGTTGSSGTVRFNYRVGWNPPKGAYNVVATASYTGYPTETRQTTFNVG
jgi:hypothetical protein